MNNNYNNRNCNKVNDCKNQVIDCNNVNSKYNNNVNDSNDIGFNNSKSFKLDKNDNHSFKMN
ncbi:MAG: hypothetical protein R3Y21_01115 [Mycoplasmatota bacterium]